MAFSSQPNFISEIDGMTVNKLNQKIDYKITDLEGRKKLVNEIISSTSFYTEYFSNYFKANINSGDHLSSNVNVCKSLERMANYLLNSDEIKEEEDKEKTKYVFHTDEKYFKKKVEREQSIEALSSTGNSDHSDSIIHFLKREDANYKIPKNQFISKKDLERNDELGSILVAYKQYEDFITSELKKSNTKFNRYSLTRIKGQLSNDMIYCKDHFLGIWGYDLQNFYESTVPNLDAFDFTNKNHLKGYFFPVRVVDEDGKERIVKAHIKGLIYFEPFFDPTNDFSLVLHDLQTTIDKAGLTDKEKFVLKHIRWGTPKIQIAEELKVTPAMITYYINGIVKKIVKVGNKYDGK